MGISLNDPVVKIGLLISTYIIVAGVCTYFGYSTSEYAIYIAFLTFMVINTMVLPDIISITGLVSGLKTVTGVVAPNYGQDYNSEGTFIANPVGSPLVMVGGR